MDSLLHILGVCGDNHSHVDLMDLLFGGALAGGVLATIKYYIYGIKLYLKSLFTKNKSHNNL